jgi:hypothetical protein
MSTVSFEVFQRIAASPAAVWSVLGNYERDHEWREGVQMRQEPPGMAAAGATTFERLRLWGSDMRVVARLEEVEPGRRLTFRTLESDVPVYGERKVEPDGQGSRVTVRIEMTPTGLWSLLRHPLRSMFRRRFIADLARLANLVERAA